MLVRYRRSGGHKAGRVADPNRDTRWPSRLPNTQASQPSSRRAVRGRGAGEDPALSLRASGVEQCGYCPRCRLPTGRCASGGGAAGRGRPSGMRPDPAGRAFSPSAVRAQVSALACTLPRDSGKPLSRWSATELARAVIQRRIVRSISGSTIKRWLNADRIKPWQCHSWQRPTDPRFSERAISILTLYERAQALAWTGHIIVCADEKTSIQARRACGRTTPARPGRPLHLPDHYPRQGAVQLFGVLLVHTGETLARCFYRKRFVEFQVFLRMLGSCRLASADSTPNRSALGCPGAAAAGAAAPGALQHLLGTGRVLGGPEDVDADYAV
jgi:hypothetical protein